MFELRNIVAFFDEITSAQMLNHHQPVAQLIPVMVTWISTIMMISMQQL